MIVKIYSVQLKCYYINIIIVIYLRGEQQFYIQQFNSFSVCINYITLFYYTKYIIKLKFIYFGDSPNSIAYKLIKVINYINYFV